MPLNPFHDLIGRIDPSRPCLVLGDGTVVTYGALTDRSLRFATVLGESGVRVGDRVVVCVDKSVDAVALYLGCIAIGAVFVPLNTAYTDAEVSTFVDDAEPAIVVSDRSRDLHVAEGTTRCTLDGGDPGSIAARAALVADPAVPLDREPSDWAAMLYTSGTTGRSKGAMLSCENLVTNARALVEAWRFEPDDVLVHVLPIFHVHGLFVALHCAFAVGATVRWHESFDVSATIADLATSTVLMGVPTHYHRLLADPSLDAGRTASMRLFTSGSAPLPARDHEEFARRTGHRIVERYGMTETMILTTNPHDGQRIAGTVGMALPGVELRVADADGAPVPEGVDGGVEVRGPGLFLGYWRLPEQTARSFRPDGWFMTGDIGSIDGEGRLTLAGRSSDVIITGGYNVYPKEIELLLDAVPGVDESAVVGLPDEDFGETIVAAVAPTSAGVDEGQLRAACAPLARFKHPRRFVLVESLPRNAMGKVSKTQLRERLLEVLTGAEG